MIQRDDLYIDSSGRVVLSNDEVCKHCGTESRLMHPAGVVPGAWLCTRCRRKQSDPINQVEEL